MHKAYLTRWVIPASVIIITFLLFPGCGGGGGGENNIAFSELKGADWQSYVGEKVVIEGYFVNDPTPMLVTDLDVLRTNSPMNTENFLILTGVEALDPEIDPEEFGGSNMRIEGTVRDVSKMDWFGEKVAVTVSDFARLDDKYYYNPKIAEIDIHHILDFPNRYAVLFSGGINSGNNRIRYWNDLKFMYATLTNNYGFSAERITVLYADGVGRDDDMPVDFSATEANLDSTFDELKEVCSENDLIFFFMTNHGGGFNVERPAIAEYYGGALDSDNDEGTVEIEESDYGRDFTGDDDTNDIFEWDECLFAWNNGEILDDDFYGIFDETLTYSTLIVVMEQCFSGGMIRDMAGPNRILMAASEEYMASYSMSDGVYDEFSYYFTCALNGATPTGTAVDADENDDEVVSILEAYNYARSHDTASETPLYEDNGDGVPHSGAMPGSGDGTLGSDTNLE